MNKIEYYKTFFNHWTVVAGKEIIDELEALCIKNEWGYSRDDMSITLES